MLQAAKNLVKFISVVKPNEDAIITLGITKHEEIEAFFRLHKGNGREIFAKLITCPTLELSQMESTSDKYINLEGMYDGYKLKVTFLNERDSNDLVVLERHDPKAGYPMLAKCSNHWNYMTPEEWEKFIDNLEDLNPRRAKEHMDLHHDDDDFRHLIESAFPWDRTKEGARYWIEISKRSEPIF